MLSFEDEITALEIHRQHMKLQREMIEKRISGLKKKSGITLPAPHFPSFRILIASHATLSPVSTPTQVTGTPFGIRAMEEGRPCHGASRPGRPR